MAKKIIKLTTLEKFEAAKKDYAAKKYDTIEEAAEANGICAATYYNYQNKLKTPIAKAAPGGDEYTQEEISKIILENQKLRTQLLTDRGQLPAVRTSESILDKIADKVIEKIFLKI